MLLNHQKKNLLLEQPENAHVIAPNTNEVRKHICGVEIKAEAQYEEQEQDKEKEFFCINLYELFLDDCSTKSLRNMEVLPVFHQQ